MELVFIVCESVRDFFLFRGCGRCDDHPCGKVSRVIISMTGAGDQGNICPQDSAGENTIRRKSFSFPNI